MKLPVYFTTNKLLVFSSYIIDLYELMSKILISSAQRSKHCEHLGSIGLKAFLFDLNKNSEDASENQGKFVLMDLVLNI